jgi:AraC family transcriptional regulator, transcriptional activator of pobA
MYPGKQLDQLLKPGFGKFFITPVEDMIRQIKLPVPPTRATGHSILYLTAGEAIMSIGSETYTIYKNECLIVPAGQVYSFANLDINKGYLCHFQNDMISSKFGKPELLKDFDFLHIWSNPRITLHKQTAGFVTTLFKRLLLDYTTNGLSNPDIIQPYLIALLSELNKASQPITDHTAGNAAIITKQFKKQLYTHIKTVHLVSDYAARLNITPNHLNKSVKAITGKSPGKWIDETIVLEAKVLLYQSDLSVNQVAAELGFDDQSYFTRLFKKYEHITPLAFRKKIEKS